jgi:uncharacterized membrane protein
MNKCKLLSATALFVTLMMSATALAADATKPAEPAKPAVAAAKPEAPKADAKPAGKKEAGKTGKKAAAGANKIAPEKVKLYRDALQAAGTKNAAVQTQIKKLRDEVTAIIAAEKFDTEAYVAKNAEIDKLNVQMRSNVTEATAGALAKFTPAERKVVVASRPAKGGAKKKAGGAKTGGKAKPAGKVKAGA